MKWVTNDGAIGSYLKLERHISCVPICDILPKDFNFVYIYVEVDTEEVAYIGRVDSPRRAGARIHDHRCEKWYHGVDYAVAFIPCLNRFESEMLETVLINRYDPKYNIDKKGWGRSVDDNPHGGYDDINSLKFIYEKGLSLRGVEESLEELQRHIKKLMVDSGEWREEAA